MSYVDGYRRGQEWVSYAANYLGVIVTRADLRSRSQQFRDAWGDTAADGFTSGALSEMGL